MSMNTKNTFWDDFAAEFATFAKPNSELNYRLYYNPQTLQGKIITLDELEGVWVDFPKENVGTSSAMDWYIKDGKLEKISRNGIEKKIMKKGGSMYFTLMDDCQFIVSEDHPNAQGWHYG